LLPADIGKEDAIAAAKAHQKVLPHVEGKSIKREIYVPGKIVNLVAQ
jgi:leucyl-tRNA synthetase